MSFYPSLPGKLHLSALWKRFPKGVRHLLAYHDALLREMDSPLEIAERELIAAHVSALNNCEYCFVAHRRYAEAFGIDRQVFAEMSVDPAHESLRPAMGAALDFAAKLTATPATMGQGDHDRLAAAGWSEDAINDIVSITALYNFMNRYLEGSGMKKNVALPGFTADKARAGRYSDMMDFIEPGDQGTS